LVTFYDLRPLNGASLFLTVPELTRGTCEYEARMLEILPDTTSSETDRRSCQRVIPQQSTVAKITRNAIKPACKFTQENLQRE